MEIINIIDYFGTYHVLKNSNDHVALCGSSVRKFQFNKVVRIQDRRMSLWKRKEIEDDPGQSDVCRECLYYTERISSWP